MSKGNRIRNNRNMSEDKFSQGVQKINIDHELESNTDVFALNVNMFMDSRTKSLKIDITLLTDDELAEHLYTKILENEPYFNYSLRFAFEKVVQMYILECCGYSIYHTDIHECSTINIVHADVLPQTSKTLNMYLNGRLVRSYQGSDLNYI